MLTPRLSKIVGGICVGLALLLVASWFSPATYQKCGYAYETYEKNCPAYSVPLFFALEIGEFLDAHNGAITALFTIALAISTVLLWQVTAKSVTIAERALTELEAPVVAVKIIETGIAQSGITGTTFSTLVYSLVNFGRTPAVLYELIDDVRAVRVGDGYPPVITNLRGPPMPYGVFIPPGGETRPFRCNIFASLLGVLSEDSEPFKTITPFFLGTARYGDIFGNLYTMGFCFLYDDATDRFIESGNAQYSYCSKHRGPYLPPGMDTEFPLAAG